jgi:nickel-type superoxide dismutase maturation protease
VGHGQGTRYSDCAAKRPVPIEATPRLPRPRPQQRLGAGASTKISPGERPGKRPRPAGAGLVMGLATLAWCAWWSSRQFGRVEVSGLSMAPALQPGDRIVVWRTRSVRSGDIVATPDPREPARLVLKRVAKVGDQGVFLLGDNPEHSTDSRQFGAVPVSSVRGKAIYRYFPPARSGRLS